MRSPVTYLVRRSLILLAVLVAADRLIGAGLEAMFYRQHHGDDVVTRYTLDSTKEDLLIFGSSRASHHYHTRMLDSILGLSVYNCGRDEMGVTYTTAVLPVIYQRYTPEYVILEILPIELANTGKELVERHISTVLLPFANRHPTLWETVAYAGKDEVYKSAVSKIYPYNSLPGAMIQNTYTGFGHQTDRGYEALYKSIDSAVYTKSYWESFDKSIGVNPELAHRLMAALDTAAAHGTRAIVVMSPFYFPQDVGRNASYNAIRDICAGRQVPLFNFGLDPRFVLHPHLFNDDLHLNDAGARIYSRIIADTLRKTGIIPSANS